jgi:serine/threonine-protein kinase
MGVVYKARDVRLHRIVAIKMIVAGGYAGYEERTRFLTEARAVARFNHPNIIQIYEVGEHEGLPFFAMEFCDGGSLADKLKGTILSPAEAGRLLETLARAMHYAHEQHVVHRDVKPANVLFTADGTPKVVDFGLAKRLDEAGQTHTGEVVGTPAYMAPEQAEGRLDRIGPWSDVYTLGAVLYAMLTGRPPFQAPTAYETIRRVREEEPVPPRQLNPGVPRDLEIICLKCLRKEPERRYASAGALADDLRRFLNGEPILARRTTLAERTVKWVQRRPTVKAFLWMSGLVALAAALYWALR